MTLVEEGEIFLQTIDGIVEVSYASHVIVKTSCHMEFKDFPFDRQICELAFGSDTGTSEDLIFETYALIQNEKDYEEFDIHLNKVAKIIRLKAIDYEQ